MVAVLLMSAKLATLILLKIKVFGNKSYDLIISSHGGTNKIRLRLIFYYYSNYIVIVVMRLKFGNSSIFISPQFHNDGSDQKNSNFLGVALGLSLII